MSHRSANHHDQTPSHHSNGAEQSPDATRHADVAAAVAADAKTRIAERAYELYESHGRQAGRADQDWYRAEQEICHESPALSAPVRSGSADREARIATVRMTAD